MYVLIFHITSVISDTVYDEPTYVYEQQGTLAKMKLKALSSRRRWNGGCYGIYSAVARTLPLNVLTEPRHWPATMMQDSLTPDLSRAPIETCPSALPALSALLPRLCLTLSSFSLSRSLALRFWLPAPPPLIPSLCSYLSSAPSSTHPIRLGPVL